MEHSGLLADISGLRYGIPKFEPLNISIRAEIIIKTGTAFLILFLKFILIEFPIIDKINIAGIVPIPKNSINNEPLKILPEAIAPAIPK